jgi:hypothetical protein
MPEAKKIKGYECKHVQWVPSIFNERDDAHFIKEIIHYEDGTTEPSSRLIRNYQREFGVTREGFRNHEDKKESEELSKLMIKKCNQRSLATEISRALNAYAHKPTVRRLARSQYLYGADISAAAILKYQYQNKWPDLRTKSKVAVLDIETDVVNGTGDLLTISITCQDKAVTVICDNFIPESSAAREDIMNAYKKYLGRHLDKRPVKLELLWAKSPGEAIKKAIDWAHVVKPDWMAIWNIDFDLPEIIKALEKEGYNIADVFSDPSVPPEFRYAEWRPGPSVKVSVSGKAEPLSWHQRWHTFNVPSSFYWIDAACVYSFIRKASGNLPSYALNYVLNKELGERKLNFEEAGDLEGIEWHQFMQSKYKVEYVIYNIFDCMGVELLDEKTNDLSITLSELIGFSEYKDFKSTPKQLADDLHMFFLLSKKRMIATTSDQMRDELDDLVIGMDQWIITLACHLIEDNGLQCIADVPTLRTLIRLLTSDLDVRSAYPYTEIFSNVSKETTAMELSSIEGVSEADRRIIGLNLTAGRVNAVELCTRAFGLPQLDVLLADYEASKKNMH